jgi:two-component sensor histidine kinase
MGIARTLYERCFIYRVNRMVLLFLQSSVKYPHMTSDYPLNSTDGRRRLEHAIVDTVREPLVVLDGALRVITASRSFYLAFKVTPDQVEGRLLYELGGGEWNIPALRTLLEEIIPQHTTMEEYVVDHDFPVIGPRTMLLNARKVFYEGNNSTSLLLAIEDVTERRALERDKDELLRQKDLLLQEMHHRVNNSLQIIASILLLKAQTVQSPETRRHLQEAHERVLAIATVQEQLHPSVYGEPIDAARYLRRLCESLAASMILEGQPLSVRVEAGEGAMTSEQAVSMGLITTELVINALKHAFPANATGAIVVRYASEAGAWRLSVSDDGIGMSSVLSVPVPKSGLGTSIVEALTRQLGGRVVIAAALPGTTVSVTVPRAA